MCGAKDQFHYSTLATRQEKKKGNVVVAKHESHASTLRFLLSLCMCLTSLGLNWRLVCYHNMKVPRHKKAHEVAMGHRGSGDSDTQHRRIRHGRILGVLLKNRKPEGKASIYQMNWFQEIAYYAKQSFQTKEAVGWGDQKGTHQGRDR